MDELFVWFVIGVIIGLIIVYIAARSFGKIAEMKGHDGKTYFWWVFWLGIFGMMMVIALPDRNQTVSTVSLSDESVKKIVKGISQSAAASPAPVFAPLSDELPNL